VDEGYGIEVRKGDLDCITPYSPWPTSLTVMTVGGYTDTFLSHHLVEERIFPTAVVSSQQQFPSLLQFYLRHP